MSTPTTSTRCARRRRTACARTAATTSSSGSCVPTTAVRSGSIRAPWAFAARATHALTLALHELSANAVKHGALSSESGHVDVKWNRNSQGGFDLMWVEKDGPPVTPPVRRGFGWTLLERVTGRELGGSATFDF